MMTKARRFKIYLLFFSVLSVPLWWNCFAPGAYSQDTVGSLTETLERLSSALRRQRERRSAERGLLENRRALLLEEIESLKRREKALASRRDTLEEESARLKDNLKELTAEGERLRQQLIEAEKVAGETAAALVNHIDSGLPLEAAARKDMIAELAGGGTPAEQMKLLWQLYVQEYRRAGEIELTSPPAEAGGAEPGGASLQAGILSGVIELEDGAKVQGRVLRIGTVGAAFLSDNGKTAAILVKTPEGYVWRRAGTYGELAELRRAFEIAAGRRAPEIVNIPLQLSTEGGGK